MLKSTSMFTSPSILGFLSPKRMFLHQSLLMSSVQPSFIINSTVASGMENSHEGDSAFALYSRMRALNASDAGLGKVVHSALDILEQAVRLYGPQNVFSSFNGGKDAVVIMHLLRAVISKYSHDENTHHHPILVYFAVSDEFPEVLQFIQETEKEYNLHLQRSNSSIMKGLADIIASKHSDQHLAFVLGTRVGDPNCGGQSFFSPSSTWMPPFMRVNPILNWDYGHVWEFLRHFNLSYCSLYDRGYTSLGKKSDTRPNPALRKNTNVDIAGDEYYPAYTLADYGLERAGRGGEVATTSQGPTAREESKGKDGRMKVASAGMIIIGDEILNGFTTASNMQITSSALGSVGVPLRRVVVVSDDEEEIAAEIRRMSQEFDLVITSGGIGPTHDDVTIKAVARAFGEDIEVNQQMLTHLRLVHAATGSREPMRSSVLRLADLPTSSALRFPPGTAEVGKVLWPVLQVSNVFVLPGIPQFFSDKMAVIAEHFIVPRAGTVLAKIVLSVDENDIVGILNDTVAAHPQVKFGSYPYLNRSDYKTILTVRGLDEEAVSRAVLMLLQKLPSESVMRVESDDAAPSTSADA